ncbi:uncharacterized protein LOC118418487 [Branchiostoma floridae]|nr:uncharacterized protein LOC118418487 [Branchiostoma floridae]
MVTLHRFVPLQDDYNTHLFTFLVSSPYDIKDENSREFAYASHKWCLHLERKDYDRTLGAFLCLQRTRKRVVCKVDYALTVLHTEDAARNVSFQRKQCEFIHGNSSQGQRSLLLEEEIRQGYVDSDGNLTVELRIGNCSTTFGAILDILPRGRADFPRYDSSYFEYGGFDWNISVHPNGEHMENTDQSYVRLNRLTHFDHFCRLRYRLIARFADEKIDTGAKEELFDFGGKGNDHQIDQSLSRLTRRVRLFLHVELFSAAHVSQVKVYATDSIKNRAFLRDTEKQCWCIESDVTNTKLVKLRLRYTDIFQMPPDYSRYVAWTARIVGPAGDYLCKGGPFSALYVRCEKDPWHEMTTTLPAVELTRKSSGLLDVYGRLTVQVDLLTSHMTYRPTYGTTDAVVWRQCQQLREQVQSQDQLSSGSSPATRLSGDGSTGHRHPHYWAMLSSQPKW